VSEFVFRFDRADLPKPLKSVKLSEVLLTLYVVKFVRRNQNWRCLPRPRSKECRRGWGAACKKFPATGFHLRGGEGGAWTIEDNGFRCPIPVTFNINDFYPRATTFPGRRHEKN